MSEIRLDPLTERQVLLAAGRAGRPNEFAGDSDNCPFCPGNEAQTPPALLTKIGGRFIDSSEPNVLAEPHVWDARVVPNKYPAVLRDAGSGAAHEVIIECRRHVGSLSELTTDELTAALLVYRQRLQFHRRLGRAAYVQIFKNVGAASGATLSHTHSQLLALPFVPSEVQWQLARLAAHHREYGGCQFCQMVAAERASGSRIVLQTGKYIAFCPAAGRFPLQTLVMPVGHECAFEEIGDEDAKSFACMLRELIGRIEHAAGRLAYNLILRTLPFDTGAAGHYHWHIEVIPRLTNIGGFELATGCFINPISPEDAAQRMRQVVLDGGDGDGAAPTGGRGTEQNSSDARLPFGHEAWGAGD